MNVPYNVLLLDKYLDDFQLFIPSQNKTKE
jgi:hypothetical protein